MSNTISVRLDNDLATWLAETAQRTGRSPGQVVRDQLQMAKAATPNRAFMRWAGVIDGPKNLSSRKGFSKT